MHDLCRADAEQDAQDFRVGSPLREPGVEAAAALFDHPEVEGRRVGDRLQMLARPQVVVAAWDGGELPRGEAGDGLREGVAEVGVL